MEIDLKIEVLSPIMYPNPIIGFRLLQTMSFASDIFKDKTADHTYVVNIYCMDRSENLIEGLVHELTEATLVVLLEELGLSTKSKTDEVIKRLHFCTMCSLPLYNDAVHEEYTYWDRILSLGKQRFVLG